MKEIATVLAEEARTVADFVSVLEQEQGVLAGKNVDLLEEITPKKIALIDQLTAYATKRDTLLSKAGFPKGPEGISLWMGSQPDTDQNAIVNNLIEASKKAKLLSDLNARLVNQRLRVVQEALTVLLPQETPSLYDTLGQSSTQVSYKLIDSA